MALATITTFSSPGLVAPRQFSGGVAVKANDVLLDRPVIDGMGQVNYGLEVKRTLTGSYYKRAGINSGDIHDAIKKGVLGANLFITGTPSMPTSIHNCGQDGIFLAGSVSRINWAFIHHLGAAKYNTAANPPHADGIQISAGTDHEIRNSKFLLPHDPKSGFASNSCVYIESDFGKIGTVVLDGLILDGGLFSLFITVGKYGPPQMVTVRNCTFLRHYYQPLNWDLNNLPPWLDIDSSNDFSQATEYRP